MTSATEVLLVLDTEFGARALELANGNPVWAVSSPANLAAAETARHVGLSFTVLKVNGASPEDWLVNHIDSVDQHHNEFSQRSAYSLLRVVGASLSPRVQSCLQEFGFVRFEAEPRSFCAYKG